MSDRKPLADIRVLDLTAALSGPFCTLLLGGLGAEIIKVEAPGGGDFARTNPPFLGSGGLHFGKPAGDDESITMLNRGRNKKSVTLNLKSEKGMEIFRQLARAADVLVENFSEGTAERLGIGYEHLREVNPRLVYCSVTGLGSPSPYPGMKVMDIIIQALSGIMEVTGFPDGPPVRVGIPIGDLLAPLYAVVGILSALHHRELSGRGQRVEVSLLDSLVSLVAEEHFDVIERSGLPVRSGNSHPRLAPFGVYRAADGYVAISGAADAWAEQLFAAMGQPELIGDPRFSHRGARADNTQELDKLISTWTSTQTVAEIVEQLQDESRRVPAAPVRRPGEVLSDPYLRARGAVTLLDHPRAALTEELTGSGLPIRLSETPAGFDHPAPYLGQHTHEVLADLLGISADDIAELRAREDI